MWSFEVPLVTLSDGESDSRHHPPTSAIASCRTCSLTGQHDVKILYQNVKFIKSSWFINVCADLPSLNCFPHLRLERFLTSPIPATQLICLAHGFLVPQVRQVPFSSHLIVGSWNSEIWDQKCWKNYSPNFSPLKIKGKKFQQNPSKCNFWFFTP